MRLSIDLGGTNVRIAQVDNGVCIQKLSEPCLATEEADVVVNQLIQLIEKMMTPEVDGIGIGHLHQYEIGCSGINVATDGQFCNGRYHVGAFLLDLRHPSLHLQRVGEHLQGALLGQEVDVVRIFHLVEDVDNLF